MRALLLLILAVTPAQAQYDTLTAQLGAGRMTMSQSGTVLSGAGAEFLVGQARRAQFTPRSSTAPG